DAVVDVRRDAHLPCMDLEDRHAGLLVGDRDLNDPVEPARAQQGLVEDVRSIRRADDLHFPEGIEAIEFREELHEGPLDLPVPGRRDLESLRTDRIEFVDEDDGRRLLAGELEQLPHEPRPLSDVLLDQLGPDESDERGLGAVGDRLGQEGLPRAGRATKRTPFGGSIPTLRYRSGFRSGSSTASRNSRIWPSRPPTSSNVTGGFSMISAPVTFEDVGGRSEEHTSELQSRFDLVCRLLLEKK